MKSSLLIIGILYSVWLSAQTTNHREFEKVPGISSELIIADNLSKTSFYSPTQAETDETGHLSESEKISWFNSNSFTQPSPPLLTTSPVNLEICTGSSTRLTASSTNVIFWYTTPPPLGSPVGTGTCYITPELTTGYYTYYAVADNGGIKSDITAMEVVMVYPTPVLSITSNVNTLCVNETATLIASGTTYYEWENGPVSAQITIRPANTQTYKVTGINTAGCRGSVFYTQVVEICKSEAEIEISSGQNTVSSRKMTTIDDPLNENKLFSVYPNPNTGEFNIRVNSISETTRVEIYNGQGELTLANKITNEISAITLNENPKGIYIVRVIENDKVLKQEKIVRE